MAHPPAYEIVIASSPEHAHVFAEIYVGGKFVALVSEERGPGLYDLETPGPENVEAMVARKVDIEIFRQAIHAAITRLSGKPPPSGWA